jgi:hypothetical protein
MKGYTLREKFNNANWPHNSPFVKKKGESFFRDFL